MDKQTRRAMKEQIKALEDKALGLFKEASAIF